MIVYKLNQSINGEKILNDIQKLVSKIPPDSNSENLLLTITIKTISSTNTSHIKKLEHKKL
jgi:hypothetical protein